MTKNKIGILGGLGPLATAEFLNIFFEIYIKEKNPKCDQDYPDIAIEVASSIPGRSQFIADKNQPNPIPGMIEALKRLENSGANLIIMPCNTAHFCFDELLAAKKPQTNFLNMVAETINFCFKNNHRKPLLLATSGTVSTNIYQQESDKRKLECIIPNQSDLDQLMEIIYGEKGVKAGFANSENAKKMADIVKNYKNEIDSVILGCTELPLICEKISQPKINTMNVICQKLLQII